MSQPDELRMIKRMRSCIDVLQAQPARAGWALLAFDANDVATFIAPVHAERRAALEAGYAQLGYGAEFWVQDIWPTLENGPEWVAGDIEYESWVVRTPERKDDFLAGICVALTAVVAFDSPVLWAEIVRSAGIDNMLNYATFVEPEEWELAGFAKYARSSLHRSRPRIDIKRRTA